MKLILVFTDWIFEICVFVAKTGKIFQQECLPALNWTHWPSIFSGEWSRQLPKCDSYLWTELLYTQMRFIHIVRAAYHYFKYLVADATLFDLIWFYNVHCTVPKIEIMYVFSKKELRNLSPSSSIHV